MAVTIRQTTAQDAPQWQSLVCLVLGDQYPDRTLYDLEWIAANLDSANGNITWAATSDDHLEACITLLPPAETNVNPITNLGRVLFNAESYTNGSAEILLRSVTELAMQSGHLVVARVSAKDLAQQTLFEKLGYTCVGFQPFKHLNQVREGMLYYVRLTVPELAVRIPVSESVPQVSALAQQVLSSLKIPPPAQVRDGAAGYPLQTEVMFHDAAIEDFNVWQAHAQSCDSLREVSSGYNLGFGLMRLPSSAPVRATLCQREDRIVAGLAYQFDEYDRCVRILDSFALDDLSIGAAFRKTMEVAQEVLNVVYLEVDVLITATQLLKCLEQLGFAPVAYLPAFYYSEGQTMDVVKMVKLNLVYSQDETRFTPQAQQMVKIIDQSFQDQKVGLAIINMLRSLPIFAGLGDGELRKVARLFNQKLFRPGELVFRHGEASTEAYVVMRGQVDIFLENQTQSIATITSGQIFGELAFLDGSARTASAVATQATILLVVSRLAFGEIVQREPHLGMVVMRNIALDLSSKLRRADNILAGNT
jgi:hypothetical protein